MIFYILGICKDNKLHSISPDIRLHNIHHVKMVFLDFLTKGYFILRAPKSIKALEAMEQQVDRNLSIDWLDIIKNTICFSMRKVVRIRSLNDMQAF